LKTLAIGLNIPDISTDRQLERILLQHFPNHAWEPWKFKETFNSSGLPYVPKEWLTAHQDHQRSFLEYIAKQYELPTLDSYYLLNTSKVKKAGGLVLLELHGWSPSQLLATLYPSHTWDISRFQQKPRNHWSNLDKQREFVETLAKSLGLDTLMDYYALSVHSFTNNKGPVTVLLLITESLHVILGAGLLDIYKGSVHKMLRTLYPEHPWKPWKFTATQHGWWRSLSNQRQFLESMRRDLGLTNSLSELYKLSIRDFHTHGGTPTPHLCLNGPITYYFQRNRCRIVENLQTLSCKYIEGSVPRTRMEDVGISSSGLGLLVFG